MVSICADYVRRATDISMPMKEAIGALCGDRLVESHRAVLISTDTPDDHSESSGPTSEVEVVERGCALKTPEFGTPCDLGAVIGKTASMAFTGRGA